MSAGQQSEVKRLIVINPSKKCESVLRYYAEWVLKLINKLDNKTFLIGSVLTRERIKLIYSVGIPWLTKAIFW